MFSRLKPRHAMCIAILAGCASSACALPKGADGFTADERDELRSLARQALSKKMGSPIKAAESDVRQLGPSATFAQVALRVADARGKPVAWTAKECQVDYRMASQVAFVVFKREGGRWVAKGTELCAVENPEWRGVDFRGE